MKGTSWYGKALKVPAEDLQNILPATWIVSRTLTIPIPKLQRACIDILEIVRIHW